MKKLLVATMIVLVAATSSLAAERRPAGKIDTNELTSETQVMANSSDNHLAMAWWIPNEFWEAVLSRDGSTSEADKRSLLDAMAGISLLAVVQADITPFGAFKFYSMEEVEKKIAISFTAADGKSYSMAPMKTIHPDLEIVLGLFKPVLGAAMGNLGNNMHFYVLEDRAGSVQRLLDPYKEGKLSLQFAQRDDTRVSAAMEFPLNALFFPRKCPNGKDAHISWKYCPWTGQRL